MALRTVNIDEGLIRELDMWRKAYGFSKKWQVEKALRYAFSFPEQVFNVKENKFLKSSANQTNDKG